MNIFDRPTIKELLDAIIDSLDEEINSENFSNDKTLKFKIIFNVLGICLLYTSPSPRDPH
mgnify:CR=1 FL=1